MIKSVDKVNISENSICILEILQVSDRHSFIKELPRILIGKNRFYRIE